MSEYLTALGFLSLSAGLSGIASILAFSAASSFALLSASIFFAFSPAAKLSFTFISLSAGVFLAGTVKLFDDEGGVAVASVDSEFFASLFAALAASVDALALSLLISV